MQLGHAGRKGATKLIWDGMDEPLEEGALAADRRLRHSLLSAQPGAARDDARRHGPGAGRFRAAPRSAPTAPASTCWSCIAATAICWRLSFRRSPIAATTNMAAALKTGCAIRWKCSPPFAPSGLPPSPCRCASPPPTGRQAALPAKNRWKSRALFSEAGCDLLDVSTGQTVHDAEPVFGRMFQTPFSDKIRNEAGIATMAVGAISSADQINTILAAGPRRSGGDRPRPSGRSVADLARRCLVWHRNVHRAAI